MQRLCGLRRFSTILGIETSCDDTAVAIITSDRKIVAAERFTNREIQKKLGGISPHVCAQQHNEHLPRLIDNCLKSAGLDTKDLTAIAVTTTPGLVIALKEGISMGINMAKKLQIPLIPVHHMRAHALSIFLTQHKNEVKFPFFTFLISGGHALIARAKSVNDFELYGQSVSGSPGECIDKVARELKEKLEIYEGMDEMHAGAMVEILAAKSQPPGHLRYSAVLPSTSGADMNFSQLKSTYLTMIRKIRNDPNFSTPDFCASLQHSVTCHIGSKLHAFLEWYQNETTGQNGGEEGGQLVVGGGVAANRYIFNGISKVAQAYNIKTFQIPPALCTDNAEMIALTGLMMLENGSPHIIHPSKIPDTIYAHAKSEIGQNLRSVVPKKPKIRLAVSSLYGNEPVRFHNKTNYLKKM